MTEVTRTTADPYLNRRVEEPYTQTKGRVTGFSQGEYTITWTNGTEDQMNLNQIRQAGITFLD